MAKGTKSLIERCEKCDSVIITKKLKAAAKNAARRSRKPFKNDRPKSLLSFLFYVTYDETIFEWFHNAPDEVPENFGLTPTVRNLIADMGNVIGGSEADREKAVDALMPYLKEEILKKHYKEIW